MSTWQGLLAVDGAAPAVPVEQPAVRPGPAEGPDEAMAQAQEAAPAPHGTGITEAEAYEVKQIVNRLGTRTVG